MAEGEEVLFEKDDYGFKTNTCQRTAELSEYLKSSVKNVLSKVMDEKFITIYKTCYKNFEKKEELVRPSLSGSSVEARKYHTQLNDIIMRSTFKTIEETVLNMDFKLKELEELKLSQLNSNICWRPPGNATQHMIAFESISEMEKKRELEGRVEREQEALNVIKQRLSQKRNKAEELNKVLLSLIKEIKTVVTNKINDNN